MKKKVGNLTVEERGKWVYVYPSSCEEYKGARVGNLPRASLLEGERGWSGTTRSCGKYSSAFSAKTMDEIVEKAVALVKQAWEELLEELEERKKP